VRMRRVVVDHFGGPEVLSVVEEADARPGRGRFASGCWPRACRSPMLCCAPARISAVPNPPFTPGYELVGVVEELGPGCSRLRVGDRIGALTVWGADAERVCVPHANAVGLPEDLDPAEVHRVVAARLPLSDARRAHELLESSAEKGKLVLVP
jgi:NADPH2:quinone reductase